MILAISLPLSIVPALYTWWRFASFFAWTKAENDSTHRNRNSKHIRVQQYKERIRELEREVLHS